MASKENGGDQELPLTTSSLFAAAASKFARLGSSNTSHRNLSPSAIKYRVSSLVAATTTATSPSSPSARKLHDLVRQASGKANSTRQSLKLSDAVVGTSSAGESSSHDFSSPLRGKLLPQKIRTSVTRMRSQRSFTGNSDSHNSTSESPATTRQRQTSVLGSASASTTAAALLLRRRYSRLPPEATSPQRSVMPVQSSSPSRLVSGPSSNIDSAFVLRFMQLLRPLQTSLSSLKEAGNGSDEEEIDKDEDEEHADALFRQHEREGSRILRICCSLDNLLFAIADQVQDHKHDLLAVVRGPAQALGQLIRNGIRQIVESLTTTTSSTGLHGETQVRSGPEGMPSLTAKEELYLRDFLVEIADRWSELDEIVHGVYVQSVETTQRELVELQTLYAELKSEKQVLELELVDLREFNANQNAVTMSVTSNFMRLADLHEGGAALPESEDARQEDERPTGYDLTEKNQAKDGQHRTATEEIEMLRKQCDEYGRLLEMAKQEIRLCHQERQAQHARLNELSQSLLRDQEVAQLRNELQAEKKRVKRLEIESLRLRETEIDLNMKIQSLMVNQPSGASKSNGQSHRVSATTTPTAATTPTQTRSRSSSVALRPEEVLSVLMGTDVPVLPTVEPSSNQGGDNTAWNFVEGEADTSSEGPSGSIVSTALGGKASWFHRLILVNENTTSESEDDGRIRRFLADLLMSESELQAAADQAKLRKRASVPTIGTPPTLAPGSGQVPIKRKKTIATPDPDTVAIPIEEWVQDATVVASVRQLIWGFYELYMMADEARRIDPESCGRATRDQATIAPSLAGFVLQFFLERHVHERDAIGKLRRFVLVLSKLRTEYGDIQLFCDFLEGNRSREELHFFLWVLQAIDAVELGVNYDVDLNASVVGVAPTRLGRYVCTLKGLYVSRMVFQWLHLTSLKKPTPATASAGGKKAKKSMIAPVAVAPPTLSSPSKKRNRKSRPHSASATSTSVLNLEVLLVESPPAVEDQATTTVSIIERAKRDYARADAANSCCPLTLESFNSVVLSFADTPSMGELQYRLGAFYQPTGDERKVALDVFLVLLMEFFATQLQWRKTQLQALFVRLAKEDEVAALLTAKIRQDEADAAAVAAQGTKGRRSQAQPEKQEKKNLKKAKLSPSKKRQRRLGIDVSSKDRYLRGMTRERFGHFLIQGGLITDQKHNDVDTLYVALLETTNRTPSEVHFEEIYSTLLRFEMLGNDSDAVDFSAWESKDRPIAQTATPPRDDIVDQWRVLASRAIVLTENDPNVFTRRAARNWMRVVTTSTKGNASSRASRSCDTEMDTLNAMRGFLAFAWRVACRRGNACSERKAQFQSCLTELFYLNQAIATVSSSGDHYASTTDLAVLAVANDQQQQHDPLAVFYEMKPLQRFLIASSSRLGTDSVSDEQLRPLQHVLQRYSVYLANLFDRYCTARFSSARIGLTKDQWLAMADDLQLIQDEGLSIANCEVLFVAVGSARSSEGDVALQSMETRQEFTVEKSHFGALLVQIAVKRYEAKQQTHKTQRRRDVNGPRTRQDSAPPLLVAQIVERFCRDVIVRHAFGRADHDNFHRRLVDPPVTKALLEHRAFLRQIFFHFAKDGRDQETRDMPPDPIDEADLRGDKQLKSNYNCMKLLQFRAFLDAFGLLESDNFASAAPDARGLFLRLDDAGVANLFRAVLAIENDDKTRMEFDDFAAAIAAIAFHRNSHPFLPWHVKIDAFVAELRRFAPRGMGLNQETTTSLRGFTNHPQYS